MNKTLKTVVLFVVAAAHIIPSYAGSNDVTVVTLYSQTIPPLGGIPTADTDKPSATPITIVDGGVKDAGGSCFDLAPDGKVTAASGNCFILRSAAPGEMPPSHE